MKRKQRFLKSSALVGCILLGAGILLCGAGFVGMGCNLNTFTYPRVEANPQSGESASSESGDAVPINGQEISHVPADTVDSLEIHASMGNVTVERTAGSQEVEIILTENVYQATVEEGLLVVRPLKSAGGQNGWNWYQLLNLHSNRDWDVTIRVPEKLLDSVFVETSMGTVDLSDLQAGSVTVQGDMGDVTLDNVSASESMTVTQSMGRVTMENCQGGTLLLENDMGDTDVANGSFTEGQITASSGSVGVADSDFTALTVDNDMGDVTLVSTQVSGAASCTVNMGSIDLDAFASPDITLSADSGNVTGTIAGRQEEYQIAVDTDMGSSNLADQMTGGPNTLEVTTNMGNIELAFEE